MPSKGVRGRIGIFYPFGNLDSVPCLFQAVEMLAEAGYQVDVFTVKSPKHVPPKFGPNIDIYDHYHSWANYRFYRFFKPVTAIALAMMRRHQRSPYRCFVGVDPEGLIEAGRYNRFAKVPLVYFSLELLLEREICSSGKNVIDRKFQERLLSRQCEWIIIQDKDRAALLREDNGLSENRFILVPNAPFGPARRAKGDYWNRKCGVPAGKKVALFAGELAHWNPIGKLARSAETWSEDWVFVVHTRHSASRSLDMRILQDMSDPDKVFFSTEPVSRDEYDVLLDSADVGVAFYEPCLDCADSYRYGENIRTIGLSSGKVAYYLRAGLPVVVNTATSLGAFVSRSGCGVAVENVSELSNALSMIQSQYQVYSGNARKVFGEELDFRTTFEMFIERLDRPSCFVMSAPGARGKI